MKAKNNIGCDNLNNKKKANLEIKRLVKTYYELHHASNILLEKSKRNDEPTDSGLIPGNLYTTMASLIFSAFTFEAYLNHLGKEKISYWNEIEKISIESKYKVLAGKFNVKINEGKRPYQTFKKLFKFRNYLAHGKTEQLTKNEEVDIDMEIKDRYPKTEWEHYCNIKNAERAKEDIEEMIRELHKKSGNEGDAFESGITFGHMSLD
jgi:hypothetical protein